MNNKVFRSVSEPIRKGLSWAEEWNADDQGLIKCWEVGRTLRQQQPELAACAENGELPILDWKGGVEKAIKREDKCGAYFYLAQWQGLRGEDLNIDASVEVQLVCSRTGVKVTYTNDLGKYGRV
ncbi:Conserved hypothetical protein [gamma proteobacterium HdN1]|nr:Conserved hypothetical protein [gamma proteobacterium HdN1]